MIDIREIYDFMLLQGASYWLPITYELTEDAIPQDLTGYTARMDIRVAKEAPERLLRLTTENGGITITEPEEGKLLLYMTPAQTESLSGDLHYDIELIDSNGDVYRLVEGFIQVAPEVTREDE